MHFQFPQNEEAFIQRNGRTARMTANGSSYLLVNKQENKPEYLIFSTVEDKFPNELILPPQRPWITLYFSGEKK